MRHILVTGGAGYVGAVVAARLQRSGYSVTVLDNLTQGHREAVPTARLVEADLRDPESLDRILSHDKFDGVVHLASRCLVEESVVNPGLYFRDNIGNGLALLDAMARHRIKAFVLSSSCAVYGNPKQVPIPEDHPLDPINPYGDSKLFLERILKRYQQAHQISSVSLRYFNACGASLDGMLGESHSPETHLIPRIVKAAADAGDPLVVNGNDYETPDGTCIRDYIHVEDIAAAHSAALERLLEGAGGGAWNIGTGSGLSVLDILGWAERVTGNKVPVRFGPRRAGDPSILVANAARARAELKWVPRHSDPKTILTTAWNWFRNRRY